MSIKVHIVLVEYRVLNRSTTDIESDTYQRTPSWKKYLTSYKERGFGIWFANGTVQAYEENTTTKDINKFKVYVTDSEYFEADLPPTSQARVFIPSRATAKTLVQAGHVGLYEFIA